MSTHATAAVSPQVRRSRPRENRWEVPIVDRNRRIVGWTYNTPEYVGIALRHGEAEKIVGGPVTATYIQIADRLAAARAGAPSGWYGPWRCLAIIAVGDVDGGPSEHVPLIEVDV